MIRPIDNPRAMMFFGSANKCNQLLAICALSKDKADANRHMARRGYTNSFRKRVINSKHVRFNVPTLEGVPFNHGNVEMWKFLESGTVVDGEWLENEPVPTKAKRKRRTKKEIENDL